MVGTYGEYQIARTSVAPQPKTHHLHDIYTAATQAPLKSSKQVISRLLGQIFNRPTTSGPKSSHAHLPSISKGATSHKDPDHAVVSFLTAPVLNGSAKHQHHHHDGNGVDVRATSTADVAGLPAIGKPVVGAPPAPPSTLSVLDGAIPSNTEFLINPRLSLVFSDVWVADRRIDQGLRTTIRQGFTRLQHAVRRSNHSQHHKQDSLKVGDIPSDHEDPASARLDAAAAAGAFFIVPGVTSRFAHSQLHAIMGPSGCGKTTLCRALAGRLPMNRICGNISVLCSSSDDNFQSESELVVCDSNGSSETSSDLSHTTGFVPQFDLLHESLTVSRRLTVCVLQASFCTLVVLARG